jgi:glycosyltransferase involved in cell wall biosynthesis
MKLRIAFFTVMPSPYQRELFNAMQSSQSLEVKVYYQQMGASDSPWAPSASMAHEKHLPGWGFDAGHVRVQFNCDLPEAEEADLWVVNASLTSPAAQWFMRHCLRKHRWLYWAEQIHAGAGLKGKAQSVLAGGLGNACGIVAVGGAAARDYQRRFPDQNVWNIPYHTDLDAFQVPPKRYFADGVPTFLFCGQMIHRKGIDVLLEAFARLSNNGVQARLLLVGMESDLRGYLSKLPSEVVAKIEYAGFKQPHELPPYFLRSDVFVLPSRYDGWGVVVNQAVAAGLPVICSDAVGAAEDLVVRGRNGVVVEAGNVADLSEAMGRLARNRTLVVDWGINSRAISRQWTLQAGTKKWEALASELFQPA